MSGALAGIRVLDFTQFMQGPWCTELLGDMGADIIKIEPPGKGDWERSYTFGNFWINGESPLFLSMNRNKRSIVINLKSDEGRELIKRMAKDADVVVENGRPGVMKRLGVDYDALREVNPSIIYASATGYGPDGPYQKRPGQDLLIQGMSGLISVTGDSERAVAAGTPIADENGSRMLAIGILAALFHRERTGEGQLVEVNLLDSLMAAQTQELVTFLNGGPKPERGRSAHVYTAAPYGIYKTADGNITIAMASIPQLGELLDIPELAAYTTLDDAFQHRDTIMNLIEDRLIQNTSEHWLNILTAADIWCGPVYEYGNLSSDPQIQHNGLLQNVDHPAAGEHTLVGPPLRMSETPPSIERPAPLLGQHTLDILHDFGLNDAEINALMEAGAIAGNREEVTDE